MYMHVRMYVCLYVCIYVCVCVRAKKVEARVYADVTGSDLAITPHPFPFISAVLLGLLATVKHSRYLLSPTGAKTLCNCHPLLFYTCLIIPSPLTY